jgi:hypothetical protein
LRLTLALALTIPTLTLTILTLALTILSNPGLTILTLALTILTPALTLTILTLALTILTLTDDLETAFGMIVMRGLSESGCEGAHSGQGQQCRCGLFLEERLSACGEILA